MTPRTIGAIALRPTGNQQGGHYFYSLMSGQRLHRTHWTELPMPAEAKDRVHALARRAKAHQGLTFTDSDGKDLDALYPEEDDDDDSDYDPDHDDGSIDSADASDDEASDASDASSSDDDDDDNYNPDLPAIQTAELAGVDTADNSDDGTPAGVGEAPGTVKTPGVGEEDTAGTAGVDNGNDPESSSQDSDYDPATDEPDSDADENEADNMNADATREQTTANTMTADADGSEDSDNDKSDDEESDNDDEDNNPPRRRLRRNRQPSYSHLKGRDGDGSLPTIARPQDDR